MQKSKKEKIVKNLRKPKFKLLSYHNLRWRFMRIVRQIFTNCDQSKVTAEE